MENLKNLLGKVRWVSVIGLIIFVLIIAFLVMKIPAGYSVQGDVGVNTKASPSSIKIGERSQIEIEVKNMNKYKEVNVSVEAKTYVNDLLFTLTNNKTISKKDILIGPKESRKITFDLRPVTGALPGKYRVDIKAHEKSYAEGAEDTVYITVKE